MDTKELKLKLKPFIENCELAGKPLSKVRLEENILGLPQANYHLVIKADWLSPQDGCDGVLDTLVDILIRSVDKDILGKVQYITVQDKYDIDHCSDELIVFDQSEKS